MKRVAVIGVLAACGPGPARVEMPPPVPVPVPGACPTAERVRPAEWKPIVEAGEEAGMAVGAPAIAHWRIPLRVEGIAWDRPLPDATFGPRTEAEVRALVAAPLGPDAWIFAPDAEPCLARVTGYYLGKDSVGGPDYTVLAAQAEGCEAAADLPGAVWAALGAADPGACRLAGAASLGGREPDWHAGEPVFPDPAPPPDAIAAAIPQRACAAPSCELLWSARRAVAPDLEFTEVSVTRVFPTADDTCEWQEDADHAVYLGRPDGPLTRAPLFAAGAEVPMRLSGVLHDDRAARVLLTLAADHYGVHPIAAGGLLGPGRIEPWYVGHEEDADTFSLWNVCGL